MSWLPTVLLGRRGAALLVAALLLPQLLLWPRTSDDAYITFRYLVNVGQGHGLVFNVGERVEGFSHPLYLALLSPALAVASDGAALESWAKLVGVLATLGTASMILDLLRRSAGSLAGIAAGMLLLLGAPGVHVYASAGLETPLLACLLAAVVWMEVRGSGWSAPLIGLAPLIRPEGILYPVMWLLVRAVRSPSRGRRLVLPALLALSPICAYEVFRVLYYGDWLPNTFYAKPPGLFGGPRGWADLLPLALGAPLIAFGHRVARARSPEIARGWSLALAFVIAGSAFVLYARRDWMLFGRLVVPVWPLAAWLMAHGVTSLVRSAASWRRIAAPTLVVAVLVGFGLDARRAGREPGVVEVMRGRAQLAGGEWLAGQIATGETVATARLGGFGYRLLHHTVWDIAGLTDREVARHIYRTGKLDWARHPVAARRPDWQAVVVDFTCGCLVHADPELERDLAQNYRLVGTVPQGPSQAWKFFRRRSVAAPVAAGEDQPRGRAYASASSERR